MSSGNVLAFGEIMLRLCPPGFKRLRQCLPGSLEATFGGGEANVCASLAMLGMPSVYLTVLPDNPLGAALLAQLRGLGVGVDRVLIKPDGRLGVYYVEAGANQRASQVVYDREGAAISVAAPADYDFAAALAGVGHVHVTGITPALSEVAFQSTLELVRRAKAVGADVSCDLNYRKKLWNWHPERRKRALAESCMGAILPYVDLLIANEEDAADVFGIQAGHSSVAAGQLEVAAYRSVAEQLVVRFPNLSRVAITLRESVSASHNNWGAMLFDQAAGQAFFAPLDGDGNYAPYPIRDIVDRVGGGDSFAAGLIYALRTPEFADPATAIAFAVAASCLKHSIVGDFNYVTRDEVTTLMQGDASGRVRR